MGTTSQVVHILGDLTHTFLDDLLCTHPHLALPTPYLQEKHELEEQRQQLLEEVQSYKKKIKQLEDDLLFRWETWGEG